MSGYSTHFPPQTYSSSFYLNALTEGESTVLVTDTDDEDDETEETKVKTPVLDCFMATMNNKSYIIFLALITISASQSPNSTSTSKPNNGTTVNNQQKTMCFIEKTKKLRTFSTLQEYQGTHDSFDPQHSTYKGNLVNFSFSTISSLSNNDFISFGSNSIIEIDLHQKQINTINAGAFKGLFCLNKLDLSYNNVVNLTEGSFEGLENLKELDLSHNKLVNIPDSGMAFLSLKNLQVLNLSYNKIITLNKLSFMMMYKLEILNLGHNKIRIIDDRVFNYLNVLKELYLNDNLLVELFADKWKGLENMTSLDLSDNYLTSFDTSANFSFFKLERLNLSGNNLQFLNVYWIRKNFGSLKSLDLANNSWFCEDLEAIKHGIIDLRINIPREVSCSEIKTTSTKRIPTDSTTSTSTTTTKPSSTIDVNYGSQLLEQNNQVLSSNKELVVAVESLRTLVIFVFLLVAVGITVEFGIRMGVFKYCYNNGRSNRGYLDSNDVESVGLISR